MTMHVAQSGIFALGTGSHSDLEFDLQVHGDPLALVQVMANLGEPRMTTGGVNLVVGFRPSLWARVAPQEMPAGVTDFERDVRGVDGYTMPATQHDLWVWVAGHAYHTVFDVAREAIAALAPVARLAAEVAGWTYKESRDLTGFSCDQHRLARMLARMAGAEDGIRDALTRYTTAVSGAYYFVPSVEALRRFASADD